MAKEKKTFVCSACGALSGKWAGQCQECKEWNTIEEQVVSTSPSGTGRYGGYAGVMAEV